MPAYKDTDKGTWFVSFYYQNWKGIRQKKMKRGFATKKDALAWEREFLLQTSANLNMEFEKFVERNWGKKISKYDDEKKTEEVTKKRTRKTKQNMKPAEA